jgi:hypothetical protein
MCVSTGNKYLDIGLSIAVGVASGGLLAAPATAGVAASTAVTVGSTMMGVTATAANATMLGMVGGATMGLATGVMGAMVMPEQPAYNAADYAYSPIAYNNMENQVTGSGGHQASAVLADEIKRAKAKRSKQQEQPKQDSYINTESFANTGLQLA